MKKQSILQDQTLAENTILPLKKRLNRKQSTYCFKFKKMKNKQFK